MDRAKRVASSWDSNAANWKDAVRKGLIPSRRAGTDDAVIKAILSQKPTRVLDVGCGEGWLCRRIAQSAGCKVIGIDGAAELVEEAQQADPHNRYELFRYRDLIEGTAGIDGSFDVIVFNYALLDETAPALLTAATRLLSDDGAIIIQTLHPWMLAEEGRYCDGWRSEDFAAFENQDWEAMPWFFRRLSSWHEVVRSADLILHRLDEPAASKGGLPLSLLMICGKRKNSLASGK